VTRRSRLAAPSDTERLVAVLADVQQRLAGLEAAAGMIPPDAVGATELAPQSVTDAALRNSAATSVIGRSANSTGAVADIAAAADDVVLRRSGGTLNFGPVTPLMVGGARGGAWRRSTAVTVATGSSGNTISPNVTDLSYAGVSLSGSTFTIASGYGGWWLLSLLVQWSASAGANGFIQVAAGAFTYRAQSTTAGSSAHATLTVPVPLSATDTFVFTVFQNSGGSITYTAKMHAVWLGPSA